MTEPDYSMYQRQIAAYQGDREYALKQQELASKKNEFDLDKMGEQALMKAQMGIPLSQQEQAAAKVYGAKHAGGIQFDPVTGQAINKPGILDTLGMGGNLDPGMSAPPAFGLAPKPQKYAPPPNGLPPVFGDTQDATLPPALPDPSATVQGAGNDLQPPQVDPLEQQYQKAMSELSGNPRAQQVVTEQYQKAKIDAQAEKNKPMNLEQSNAATFADRMSASDSILNKNASAGESPWQNTFAEIPLVGNYLTSPQYQQFDQGARDFINAQLRRESGSAIQPSEFDNARKQYLPQPGDSPEVLLQKAQNRKRDTEGMVRAAGDKYKPKGNAVDWQEYFK